MDQIRKEKLTLGLSFVAYKGLSETEPRKVFEAIQDGLDAYEKYTGKQEIVWGPAIHKLGMEVFSDALMFVVRDVENPLEYTIVIRGTSPLSLSTFLLQDLWVINQVYWDTGNAPVNAKISMGSYLGLHFIQKLKPNKSNPGNRKTIIEFLQEIIHGNDERITINITGHSLGGTLAATLSLWLDDKSHFTWPGKKPEIYTYSYAAFTAGNRAFARYSNETLGDKCYRYCNPLDVAPLMFNRRSMKRVPNLYKPFRRMGILIWLVYKWLYNNLKHDSYTQVRNPFKIASEIDKSKWFFCTQLDYQHNDAYLNHLAGLVDTAKTGRHLMHELDLEGETSRFSKRHMLRTSKKAAKKIRKAVKNLQKRHRVRSKLRSRK